MSRTYHVFSAAYDIFREIFGGLMMALSSGESNSFVEVRFCFSTLFNFMNSKFLPYGLGNKATHF